MQNPTVTCSRAPAAAARFYLLGLMLLAVAAGTPTARAQTAPVDEAPATRIELPLISGWFQGRVVQYVTTDVSDKDAAKAMGANFVPRLANAIPPLPKAPGQPSAVERIYAFTNFRQGGVFPSIPNPTGAENGDRNYSPLWQVHKVTWNPGAAPRVLKSEEEVLEAADKGLVTITQTGIVVNCPVVFSAQGGLLPHLKLLR